MGVNAAAVLDLASIQSFPCHPERTRRGRPIVDSSSYREGPQRNRPLGKKAMTVITIEQAGKYDGQEVTLKGWLYNLRESGKLLFPIFRDGTGIIQGVCALKENPEAFESLKALTQESSVIVTGKIRAEKRAPGGYEIGVTKIQIVQKVPESTPFPIQLKEHGVDFLLDRRHLWIRTPRQAAILRIRAEAIRAAREYMDGQGYTLTDA